MTEEINLPKNANKEEIYKALLPQVKALLSGEEDLVANMANMSAVLKEAFGFFWVGFYNVKKGELVLGPFQGPVACTRIQKGKGVCGKAWESGETQLVPDVNAFPGHIACSASSQSEIVVPVSKVNEIIAVLDIDSDQLDTFDAMDQKYLEEMVGYL
jgi:GAF domain-containing protein